MNRLIYEMEVAARQAPRLYFAPFVGAVQAMQKEVRALRHSPASPAKDTKGHAEKAVA